MQSVGAFFAFPRTEKYFRDKNISQVRDHVGEGPRVLHLRHRDGGEALDDLGIDAEVKQ